LKSQLFAFLDLSIQNKRNNTIQNLCVDFKQTIFYL
jgi:hypothetical protein